MRGARHLRGNGGDCFSLEISVVAIAGDVAFIFGSETVISLPNGYLSGDPKGSAQTSVAKF
jgi:hypothetical protein